MRYIDFDGVILDTKEPLFENWDRNVSKNDEEKIVEYMKLQNWRHILMEAKEINDSLHKLREMDPQKSAIITKVHSFENEAVAKLEYLRGKDIKQSIIFVPHFLEKADIVNAKNNILVDDSLMNLKIWEEAGGYPIFFDMDFDGIDPYGYANTYLYQKTRYIDAKARTKNR